MLCLTNIYRCHNMKRNLHQVCSRGKLHRCSPDCRYSVMISITYPAYRFRIKAENGREFIFDEWRKLWVRLTPEEWVRQNFLQYLVGVKAYPASLIAVEKKIQYGELSKRFDILVYDASHVPWMMIECKAMEVTLNEKVLHQVLRYNMSVPVTYLVITNGVFVAAFERNASGLHPLNDLPVVTGIV